MKNGLFETIDEALDHFTAEVLYDQTEMDKLASQDCFISGFVAAMSVIKGSGLSPSALVIKAGHVGNRITEQRCQLVNRIRESN